MPTKARVLIVDDSPEQIRLLGRVLERDGFECLAVSDGARAVATCIAATPDVVLLDIQLPGRDGLSICRELKERVATRFTPVLMMTGLGDSTRRLAALEAGADDFLSKPVRLSELRARVRSASRLKQQVDQLDDATASLLTLAATIDARDHGTDAHCRRVAEYAVRIGARLGLPANDLRALDIGGQLHDIGKIAIPDAVLFHAGPLTAEQWAVVKTHPVVGERICAPLRSLSAVRSIIRHHHERLDGSGYPDGLRGAQVPLLAQIVGVVDVFDALTTSRPYRPAQSFARAWAELQHEARRGWRERSLVDALRRIVEADAAGCDRRSAELKDDA